MSTPCPALGVSNLRLTLPPGLLRLEELVRGFLISKETLSVRMLDDSHDPTPLLKEIRDDKVSTIIIDANASISHLILRKVGPPSLIPVRVRARNMGGTERHPMPTGRSGRRGLWKRASYMQMIIVKFVFWLSCSPAAPWLDPGQSPPLSVNSCCLSGLL